MAKPAAREADPHDCPKFSYFVIPHSGGPIEPPCSPTVEIDGKHAARVGDKAHCRLATDTVMMGSSTVYWDGAPAARKDDLCMHGGKIVNGSPTVLIGGANMIGNPLRAADFFPGQQANKDTCAVMSTEGVVWQVTGKRISEPDMQAIATKSGAYKACNGTTDESALLREAGIPAHEHSKPSLNDIRDAVREGRAVIVGYDTRATWNWNSPDPAGHAVRVTGVEVDDHGNVTAVIINDTGNGQPNFRVPAETFQRGLDGWGGGRMATTDDPVLFP
jgi:uncharacterized Zn-binding protein involved in type VI secretion